MICSDVTKLTLFRYFSKSIRRNHNEDMNEAWARCVDLPGLEDNISPNNNINILFGFVINEV